MSEGSVVMPAVRIPRKLWLYPEEVMRRKMFSSKAELVKDALREYVTRHVTSCRTSKSLQRPSS